MGLIEPRLSKLQHVSGIAACGELTAWLDFSLSCSKAESCRELWVSPSHVFVLAASPFFCLTFMDFSAFWAFLGDCFSAKLRHKKNGARVLLLSTYMITSLLVSLLGSNPSAKGITLEVYFTEHT